MSSPTSWQADVALALDVEVDRLDPVLIENLRTSGVGSRKDLAMLKFEDLMAIGFNRVQARQITEKLSELGPSTGILILLLDFSFHIFSNNHLN
jgi:hypothetical protein